MEIRAYGIYVKVVAYVSEIERARVLIQKQVRSKYRRKHFPRSVVFIYYIHTKALVFLSTVSFNLSKYISCYT